MSSKDARPGCLRMYRSSPCMNSMVSDVDTTPETDTNFEFSTGTPSISTLKLNAPMYRSRPYWGAPAAMVVFLVWECCWLGTQLLGERSLGTGHRPGSEP